MLKGFINAEIWRKDSQAFLIEDGKFIRFGTNEEIEKECSSQDEVVDLKGAFVVPGFVDSHMHLLEYGNYLRNVQLKGTHSTDDILARLRARLSSPEKIEWIIGRGYNEEEFNESHIPTKQDLDGISHYIPISITRSCGHKMVVNSKALELAGIGPDSTIDGGKIDFEHGWLEETALNVIHDIWPKPTVDSMKQDILAGAKAANRYGITYVGSDDFLSLCDDWRMALDAYMQLSYQEKLPLRVEEQCEFISPQEFAAFLDEGYTYLVGDDYFHIGPLKLVTDGSLGARTAALLKPYNDAKDTRGYMCYERAEMKAFMELAAEYNMPTICHAIGDKAVDTVLKLYEKIVLPGNPLHHGLVHCQIMTPEQTQKVVEMKLNCYFQSLFIDTDAKMLEARVGKDRAKSSYPFKTLFEGTCASNGSDAPVEEPDVLKGIELAVTRTSLDGSASMNRSECLSVEEALESYTDRGYDAFVQKDHLGSFEEGYDADFAVIDHNILNMKPEEIHTAKVIMTVMKGNTVFER
ncbi:MAG: amidohydrolase [Bulleidia sp.]|nr:amidohydrolase [Bulleidia sp.]